MDRPHFQSGGYRRTPSHGAAPPARPITGPLPLKGGPGHPSSLLLFGKPWRTSASMSSMARSSASASARRPASSGSPGNDATHLESRGAPSHPSLRQSLWSEGLSLLSSSHTPCGTRTRSFYCAAACFARSPSQTPRCSDFGRPLVWSGDTHIGAPALTSEAMIWSSSRVLANTAAKPNASADASGNLRFNPATLAAASSVSPSSVYAAAWKASR
jgi:hypothetical protein